VLIAALLSVGLYIYHHRDEITAKALQAIMTKMAYPTQVKKVHLSLWRDFPQLSLVLDQVVVQGPHQGQKNILVARQIDCALNVVHLMQGKYIIDHVAIDQGMLNLSTTRQPTSQVMRTSFAKQVPLTFKKLILKHIDLLYIKSGKHPITLQTHIQQAQVSMDMTSQHISMHVVGQTTIRELAYQHIQHQATIPTHINTQLHYDFTKQVLTIISGSIKQPSYTLQGQGKWSLGGPKPFADCQISTQQIDIQQLLPWLPPSLYQQVAPYQPQGKLACQLHWKQHRKSSLQVDFRWQEGNVLLPGITERLQIARLTGKLNVPIGSTEKKGSLQVSEYVAAIGPSELRGSFQIMDLQQPHLQARVSLNLDLPTLVQVLSYNRLTHITGQLTGNLELNARLASLSQPITQQTPILLTGECKTQDVQFRYNQARFQLQDTKVLLKQDDTWSIPELVGQLDGKPFVLSGQLHQGSALLLKGRCPVHFTAKLYADYLALDKLLLQDESNSNSTSSRNFTISPCISGVLICDVEEAVYKRFHGKKLRGNLQINNQQLKFENLACGFAGGNIRLAGTLDTQPNELRISMKVSLQNVQLATLFYTFDNFQQHFLEDKHLGGQLYSDVSLSMRADQQFNIDTSSIHADMSVRLQHGVLKNFEPLQRLSSYVSEKNLRYLYFSHLKNNIHIQDRTIHIPSMEVHTSVTSIQLSGTHTFDGKIDYNLIVPLQQADPQEVKQSFVEIDEAALGGLNLYLKLEGNVKDYKLHYDNTLLKKDFKENLRKQGDMLGSLLKGKPTKKQDKELATDEYFDFS
jgi:hypothetical protein